MKDNVESLRKEVSELKKQLNEFNVEKERWFSTKENLKKDISELIKKVRIFKSTKDRADQEIKILKEKRDLYNKEVKELIREFKHLNSKKERILKERKIKFNPNDIIKKIEDLEFKLETEAISFTKEQQIMKQIKFFKKELGEVQDIQDLFKELKSLSEKITATKDIADDYHKKIANAGKTSYQEFVEMTKQINELKKKQEDAFKKFIEYKNKFLKINEELKIKLREAGDINIAREIKTLEIKEKELEEKAKKVEEKLKKNKKLTTEDLIIFQNSK